MASTPVQLTLDIDEITVERLAAALAEFSAFIGQLDAELSPKGRRTLSLRITSLTYNSPAEIGVQVEARKGAVDNGPAVLGLAVGGIREIERFGTRPARFPYESLEHLRALAGFAPKGQTRIVAPTLNLSTAVTPSLAHKIERVLGQSDAVGAIEGQLDTVSVHGRQYFTIYDAVTGRGVRSYFPDAMLARAVAALGKKVIVHGRLRRDPFGVPHEIREVDTLHTLGNLSTPHDSVAGAYRGLDVKAYLAEIRGE